MTEREPLPDGNNDGIHSDENRFRALIDNMASDSHRRRPLTMVSIGTSLSLSRSLIAKEVFAGSDNGRTSKTFPNENCLFFFFRQLFNPHVRLEERQRRVKHGHVVVVVVVVVSRFVHRAVESTGCS